MAKSQTKMIIAINEPILSKVIAVRGDANSRFIDVQLYNDGVPVDLTSHTVTMSVKTNPKSPMKNPVDEFISGTIPDPSNGRCMFPLTTSMLAEAGALDAQISVFSGEQEVLSTLTFIIYVEPSLRSDEQIEAENEFGVLVVLFSEIQNALDDMHAIRDNFGEPSQESTEQGITTFWGIIEQMRKDVSSAVAYDLPEKIGEPDDTSDMPTMFGKIKLNNELLEANLGGEKIFDTAGTFSFVVPDYVTQLKVVAAAGGGGGAGYGAAAGGGGGSGGDCVVKKITVTPKQTISITVGKGGAGSPNSNKASDGGATIIQDYFTVSGGIGAVATRGGESSGNGSGAGGSGGSDGYAPKIGGNGLFGYGGTVKEGNDRNGGGGGGSYGNGGDGGIRDVHPVGYDGKYGGGGGGSALNSQGGNGGDGIVIIRWGIFDGNEVPLT